jgi:hypothetical protein
LANISDIVVTLATFHEDKSPLNAEQPKNATFMLVVPVRSGASVAVILRLEQP